MTVIPLYHEVLGCTLGPEYRSELRDLEIEEQMGLAISDRLLSGPELDRLEEFGRTIRRYERKFDEAALGLIA